LGPRPGNMSQNDPKTTSLMTSVTKNLHPPTKKVFFRVQSTRLADPFAPLNSSLAQISRLHAMTGATPLLVTIVVSRGQSWLLLNQWSAISAASHN